MTEEEKEFIDVESDEDGASGDMQFANPLDKRAHHNALERKRRDHIKESFNSLRDAIPGIHGEKASRAQILKSATEYITTMKGKSNRHKNAIDELRNENKDLEDQIASLEQLVDSNDFAAGHTVESYIEETTQLEETTTEPEYHPPRRKKAKN